MKRVWRNFGLVVLATFMASIAVASVEFNYQGQVSVRGIPYNGTGKFKLAIVNEAGSISLWSNDGSSIAGGEPNQHLSIGVVEGIFNIAVGDKKITGMSALPPSIFNTNEDLFLRIWFSDGTHGFQTLLPDKKITNKDLLGRKSGDLDIVLYVNAATGSDSHSGLSAARAKKTIQSAVNALPGRIQSNVTIVIANGVYREEVKIFGISVEPGKQLVISGDISWNTTSSNDPGVRITGCDNDTTKERLRESAIFVEECSRVLIKGILVDYTRASGIRVNGCTSVTVDKCKASYCTPPGIAPDDEEAPAGIFFYQSTGWITNVVSDYNGFHGIKWASSIGYQRNTFTRHNFYDGTKTTVKASLKMLGDIISTHNGEAGLSIILGSDMHFAGGAGYKGTFTNNGRYGIIAQYGALITGNKNHTFAANTPADMYVGEASNDFSY